MALVLVVLGFFLPQPRGGVALGAGLALGSLAGLELAVREHFAGYRSHSLLIAGAAGMAVFIGLAASGAVAPIAGMAAGLVVAGIAGWALATAFRRRSGGALFRVRGGG